MALIDLARFQLHPAAADVDDDLAEEAIEVASEMVQKYCGQMFESDTYTEYYSGIGRNQLFLNQLPIETITSIGIVSWTNAGPVLDAIDLGDFILDEESGELRFIDQPVGDYTFFPAGFRNIMVEYVAGYDTSPGSGLDSQLPHTLQEAIVIVALGLIEVAGTSNMLRLGAENAGDYKAGLRSVVNTVGIPPKVKLMLTPFMIPRGV